jgi:hypothetical protein
MPRAVLAPRNVLEVALRTLNASCLEHEQPAQADEACLRQMVGDHTTPIDELACEIIQSELRRKGTPPR